MFLDNFLKELKIIDGFWHFFVFNFWTNWKFHYLTILTFWEFCFRIFVTIVTVFNSFFWQLWPFLTTLKFLDNFCSSENFYSFVSLTILDNFDNDNPRFQFWQSRTWSHDNLCDLTIKSDAGEHTQFLQCFSFYYKKCSDGD